MRMFYALLVDEEETTTRLISHQNDINALFNTYLKNSIAVANGKDDPDELNFTLREYGDFIKPITKFFNEANLGDVLKLTGCAKYKGLFPAYYSWGKPFATLICVNSADLGPHGGTGIPQRLAVEAVDTSSNKE